MFCHVPVSHFVFLLEILDPTCRCLEGELYFQHFTLRNQMLYSFTPQPLCPRGKSPLYPSGRRLDRSQSLSGPRDEEKVFSLLEIEP
jgi:hypothetical protein